MTIKRISVFTFLTLFLGTIVYSTHMYQSSYRFNRMAWRTGALVKTMLTQKSSYVSDQLPSHASTYVLYCKLMAEYITSEDYTPRQRSYGPFTINYFSPYDLSLLVHEVFVRHVYAFTSLKPDPTILDCGSNIGISILFFKALYPEAKIIGFEAHPQTFQVLEKNIKDNGLSNVKVYNAAVYDSLGTINFPRSINAPGHPGMSIDEKNSDTTAINTMQVSDHINGEIDFIKIDIEGAEGAVIRDLVNNHKLGLIKQMIIEYHDNGNENNNLTEILSALDENDFKYMIHSEVALPFVQGENAGMMVYAWRG